LIPPEAAEELIAGILPERVDQPRIPESMKRLMENPNGSAGGSPSDVFLRFVNKKKHDNSGVSLPPI